VSNQDNYESSVKVMSNYNFSKNIVTSEGQRIIILCSITIFIDKIL